MKGLVPLLPCLALVAGCAPSPGLWVLIDTDVPVPDQIDAVTVALSAAGLEPEPHVCEESSILLSVDATADLPLRVLVEPGTRYGDVLAYRVAGWRRGVGQVFGERVGWTWLPDDGRPEVEIFLEAGCLSERLDEPCEPPLGCVEGTCGPVAGLPELFSDPAGLDAVPCFPGAP